MNFDELKTFLIAELEEMQAIDIVVLDVRQLTSITDMMIICTGNSTRHVKSVAQKVAEKAKAAGLRPLGIAGEEDAEWVLVDLGDAMIHVMQAKIRQLYQLEHLWDQSEPDRSAANQ
jgi:ribosome-associated protein